MVCLKGLLGLNSRETGFFTLLLRMENASAIIMLLVHVVNSSVFIMVLMSVENTSAIITSLMLLMRVENASAMLMCMMASNFDFELCETFALSEEGIFTLLLCLMVNLLCLACY